ncbi:MAG: LytTR family DNA-binding domain-containing protein [Bacteroidetes bacterium]|nr:LytTR family DNA-binding domain-containing protein [Bacteroidota bacterium]
MKCVIIDDDKMSRDILEHFISKHSELELVKQFDNPVEAVSFLKLNKIDLIFLDVEMPQMTGMEFIACLADNHPKVIFTTSHTQFAIEAFKYNVSGYLVKPVKFDQFSLAMKKVLRENISVQSVDFKDNVVFIKEGKTIVKMDRSDIKLIECVGDYVTLFSKDRSYVVHATMKSMESRFSNIEYIRVHRSFIIRLDAIEDIEDDTIAFGDKLVPIGKTYKKDVYKRLNIM